MDMDVDTRRLGVTLIEDLLSVKPSDAGDRVLGMLKAAVAETMQTGKGEVAGLRNGTGEGEVGGSEAAGAEARKL